MTWKDLSVRQYLEVKDAMDSTTDNFEQVCLVVSIVFNKTHSQINNMAAKGFLRLSRRVEELFKEEPKGVAKNFIGRYKVDYNVGKYKWRQYVEIQHWLKMDFEYNFHLVLASAVNIPLLKNKSGNHKKVADRLLGYKFTDVFFSVKQIVENIGEINARFFPTPEPELEEEAEEIKEQLEEEAEEIPTEDYGTDFNEKWGWVYSTKRIADFRNITLDEAYELSTMQALNDLQLIRELQEHEEKQFKNAKTSSKT